MKRVVFAVVFILGAFFAAFGQEGPIDLVLLLDTSSSMSGSYREVNDYMTGGFLKEFLRAGDTFHLIPFSDTPRVDVSRRIEGRGDVETIIGRMLLQYPLEPGSDISGALAYAEKYVSTLPARPKKIILLTDGNTNPVPGGGAGNLDAAGLQNLIAETKTRLGRQGIVLEYVKVPLTSLPSAGRPPQGPVGTGAAAGERQTPPAAEPPRPPAQTGAPQGPAAEPVRPAQTPGAAQPVPPTPPVSPTQPLQTGPGTQSAGPAGSVPVPGTPPPRGVPESSVPGAGGDGPASGPAPSEQPSSPGGIEPSPGASPVQPAPSPQPARPGAPPPGFSQDSLSLPLIIGLAVLGIAVLGLIIFLVTRRLQGTPNRAMAQAAAARQEPEEPPPPESRFADHSAALASYAATQRPRTGPYAHRYKPQTVEYEGPLLLNLFVEDQSTLIGKRNIHAVKPGYTFTVGGGKSDFLIFLVPMPSHIGEVRCTGNNCTFIPRKPQYFPDIGSQQVSDCIGKTIRVISDKNYELHFRLERYEDPLKALNRLLRSVQVPG